MANPSVYLQEALWEERSDHSSSTAGRDHRFHSYGRIEDPLNQRQVVPLRGVQGLISLGRTRQGDVVGSFRQEAKAVRMIILFLS